VLAEVGGKNSTTIPLQGPTGRPIPSIRPGIVDRDLVAQGFVISARKALRQGEKTGVRQSAVREPKIFIEVRCVHDQRIAFPFTGRAAEI
jgi:hypothetical protein